MKQRFWCSILMILLAGCSAHQETDTRQLSWGDPDLQGAWDYRTATPLSAPDALGDRIHFTNAEKDAFEAGSTERGVAFVRKVGDFVGDEPWVDRGQTLTEDHRAALIVDPPNGRLPPRTEYGKELAGQWFGQMSDKESLNPESRTVLERCIVAPLVPLRPMNFNNNIQIIQSPNHVVILNEMIHDARVIPIQRPGKTINVTGLPRWLGESVGRWEGETLVVETSNFRSFPNLLGTSADLHLTERFSVADDSRLVYEYTVDDPQVFSQPWSARQTLTRLDGRLYEYACHEGNVSMTLMLRGARVVEREQQRAGE